MGSQWSGSSRNVKWSHDLRNMIIFKGQRYNGLNVIFSRHNESFSKSNINNEEASYGEVGVAEDSLQAIDISNGDLNHET